VMPKRRYSRATACLFALLLSSCLVGAAACDPNTQSCAPVTPPVFGGGSGGQSCTPSPGGATCDGSGPAAQGNGSNTNLGAGNPINLINGNKYQREVDMPALPGVLGLELVRHYNSQYSLPNVPTGVMGHGWKLSYETELFDTPVGLQIVQADGTRLIFQKSQGDPSHCSGQNPANGSVTILQKPQGKEYLWRWRGNGTEAGKEGGRSLLFNGDGKLVQISAPTGEFVTLLYSPRGWLLQVRDPQGRELKLHYLDAAAVRADPNGSKAFRGVQSIDSPVGRFSYGYGNELTAGSKTSKTLTVANLNRVGIPTWFDPSQRTHAYSNISPSRSSVSRFYHYEDPHFPTLLTGISVQGSGSDGVPISQRIGTYAYDGRGKAILSKRADGAEKVTLDNSTAGQTVVTNSLGQTTRYKYANIAGLWRLLESRGAGCAGCGPANVAYGYDKLGRLTEQTVLGQDGTKLNGTRTTLDAQGRTIRMEQVLYSKGKPGPAQLQQRFEYAAETDTEPKLIARPSVVAGKEHQIRIRYNTAGQATEITESGFEPLHGQAISRTTGFSYETINGNSLLTAIDGPLPNGPANSPQDSDITRLEWDKGGNFITRLTQPGGVVQAVTHDPGTGLITQVKNDQGSYTEFVYNTRTQLATLRSGGPGWKQPRVQSMRFDALGNPSETGSGEDHANDSQSESFVARTKQSFDALGRLQWSANALGILTQNRFDSESHLLETGRYSNAMAKVQSYVYNAQGQLSGWSNNQGQGYQIRYNALGLPSRVIDALGRDAFASASSSKLRSRQWTDDFGRVVATVSPDSGTTTRRFDAADRMMDSSDAKGNQAHYAYDLRGRIQQQTIQDAAGTPPQTTTWEYQGARLIALHHPTQSERYTYDERGLRTEKVTTVTLPQGSFSSVTRYQFDDSGVLQSTSLPDGSQVEYERNGQGQLIAVKREHIFTSWLRWAAPAQTIVQDLQRDIVGLKRYTTGNGIEATFLRSHEGTLARVVYRPLALQPMAMTAAEKPSLPGALSFTTDPGALLDHRYLWDGQGNLLYTQSTVNQSPSQDSYAYDGKDRLIAAVSPQAVSRYFYDAENRRVLSQQGIQSQEDTHSNTQKISYQPGSHHWVGADSTHTSYDANGHPQAIGQREYVWDALGKLITVREQDKTLASYHYNHRGERVAKSVGDQSQGFLYDNQQLIAELNAQGQLTRQYLYLADQPIAVIDTPEGQALHQPDASAIADIGHDLQTIVSVWFTSDNIVWLHANHLGAPEAATDATGKLIWQARYAAFGQAHVSSQSFSLNLRLPGQYADAESGLHYNRQRYYDPERGQYLTPDPLGTPNGPNGYAYVNYNPLKYVDPDGLVLFAFDGTGNTNDEALLATQGSSLSNVWKFRQAYADGDRRYISGVGTLHQDSQYGNIENPWYQGGDAADMGLNLTGPARIDRMLQYFNDEATAATDDNTAMEVDIVGFSRGAAEARDFANQIVNLTHNGMYRYQATVNGKQVSLCQKVDFRFMGLWDTVLSTNASRPYQLAIPSAFTYVAQAVALNEYRGDSVHPYGSIGAFPLESIMPGMYSTAPEPGVTRIERGFIGSHADIGGGFATNENQLAQVALAWMVQQAKDAGVSMNNLPLTVPPNPVIHDKSDSIRAGAPSANSEDRAIRYGKASLTTQRDMPFEAGMSYLDTQTAVGSNGEKLIDYLPSNDPSRAAQQGQSFVTGTVNMKAYLQWLKDKGYELGNLQVQ